MIVEKMYIFGISKYFYEYRKNQQNITPSLCAAV
jgi:hypothetical protein